MNLFHSFIPHILMLGIVAGGMVHEISLSHHKVAKDGLKPIAAASYSRLDGLNYYRLAGNVTIGTPGQKLYVEIDFFDSSELTVLESNATPSALTDKVWTKQRFNSSASRTFLRKKGNFSTQYYGSGNVAEDRVNMNGVSAKVILGVITSIGYFYESSKVAGRLGLSPMNTRLKDNRLNFLGQIADNLDQPIVSLWKNRHATRWINSSQLTLGAEDTKHCHFNWAYAPRLKKIRSLSAYVVNASMTSAYTPTGDLIGSIPSATIVDISPALFGHSASKQMFSLMVKATGATYNASISEWSTDCDTSKMGNVVLTIGNGGKLVLTPDDLVLYNSYYRGCYLNVLDYYHANYLTLGSTFLENHCLAYNLKTNHVGFATAK